LEAYITAQLGGRQSPLRVLQTPAGVRHTLERRLQKEVILAAHSNKTYPIVFMALLLSRFLCSPAVKTYHNAVLASWCITNMTFTHKLQHFNMVLLYGKFVEAPTYK
jgi:hypothetical protein